MAGSHSMAVTFNWMTGRTIAVVLEVKNNIMKLMTIYYDDDIDDDLDDDFGEE